MHFTEKLQHRRGYMISRVQCGLGWFRFSRLTVKSLLHTPGELPKGKLGERGADITLRLKRVTASAHQYQRCVMEIGRFPNVIRCWGLDDGMTLTASLGAILY